MTTMKKLLLSVGFALSALFLVSGQVDAAQPTLNRGTCAYAFGVILDDLTANTQSTDVFELYEIDGVSVQVDHGNITGTLLLESSNDGLTYYPVLGGSFTAISGVGGEVQEVTDMTSRYYRFTYTHSSGSSFIKITLHAKGCK